MHSRVVRADSTPYLSVVTVMRNDDYGGHLLHRFRRSIQTLGMLVYAWFRASVFGFRVSGLHGIVQKDVV